MKSTVNSYVTLRTLPHVTATLHPYCIVYEKFTSYRHPPYRKPDSSDKGTHRATIFYLLLYQQQHNKLYTQRNSTQQHKSNINILKPKRKARRVSKCFLSSVFVRMSAHCSFPPIELNVVSFRDESDDKHQRACCACCEKNSGNSQPNALAPMLFSNIEMLGDIDNGCNSIKIPLTYMASVTPSAIATYAVSVDSVTLFYILVSQTTNAPPLKVAASRPNARHRLLSIVCIHLRVELELNLNVCIILSTAHESQMCRGLQVFENKRGRLV